MFFFLFVCLRWFVCIAGGDRRAPRLLCVIDLMPFFFTLSEKEERKQESERFLNSAWAQPTRTLMDSSNMSFLFHPGSLWRHAINLPDLIVTLPSPAEMFLCLFSLVLGGASKGDWLHRLHMLFATLTVVGFIWKCKNMMEVSLIVSFFFSKILSRHYPLD